MPIIASYFLPLALEDAALCGFGGVLSIVFKILSRRSAVALSDS